MTQNHQPKTQPAQFKKQWTRSDVSVSILLILAGISLNKWAVERILAADEHIESIWFIGVIVIFQLGCIALGLWLLFRSSTVFMTAFSLRPLLRLTGILGLTAAILIGGYGNLRVLGVIDPHRELREAFRTIEVTEELILEIEPTLKLFNKSVMNLQFPDYQAHTLFDESVTVLDIAAIREATSLVEGAKASRSFERYADNTPQSELFLPTISVGIRTWQVANALETLDTASLNLWRPLLNRVEYFEYAEFKIEKGHLLNKTGDVFETVLLFDGVARMKSGALTSVKSVQTVRWRKRRASENLIQSIQTPSMLSQPRPLESNQTSKTELIDASVWQIYDWRTESLQTTEATQPLFREMSDTAIADPKDRARARHSIHEQLVAQAIQTQERSVEPYGEIFRAATFQHPAISVVDLDRDGFDDFYMMARWGENMFFRNRGDGTFEEIAAELGLNIKDYTASALFADFDNDGDTDLFLGRTFARSVYLRNENGQFVERSTELVNTPLPYLVTSISAMDYNGDGLLDLYLSTYAPSYRLKEFLPEADFKKFDRFLKSDAFHPYLNVFGPPNVLLKNVGGGKFEIASESAELHLFRPTFQSAWSDFDGDGDADVYVVNDFATNNLFRNDGGGKFVDITEQTGTADIGFGMGASWGDYDNDGKHDLYITNMYSKAGRRITTQLPQLDAGFAKGARGNSLFRNASLDESPRFDNVSGLKPPSLMVETGGWGWGGQFIDVDNDGYLDIYALSGYFTAPKAVAGPVDI